MKTKKTIAVFAIILVAISLFIVGIAAVSNILPRPPMPPIQAGNFIMWTNDGNNLMWGSYKQSNVDSNGNSRCPIGCYIDSNGNTICSTTTDCYFGEFKGQDSNGKNLKGYFTKTSFYGYYEDGTRFYGSYYSDSNQWKASGLFGLRNSYGEYKNFPFKIVIDSTKNKV